MKADTIELPAPTAWPIVLAFGLALVVLGMVTHWALSALGAVVAIAGGAGWFRDVLPYARHERVPVLVPEPAIATRRATVAKIALPVDRPRAALPLENYPVSAGVKGGIAGGVAMAILATAYGVVVHHSVWYPINLLALGFFPASISNSIDPAAFNGVALTIGFVIHALTSLTVGLLYGATLPMVPRRPILFGGLVAPLMWSALIYSTLGIINQPMNERIAWGWFIVSQVGYGLVAGLVVSRQNRIETWHQYPWAIRAGIEAPGVKE